MTTGALLIGATVIVLVACVLLVIGVVVVRARRNAAKRRSETLMAPLRIALLTVASGEDDDGAAAAALESAVGDTREVVDERIVEVLRKIRGVPAEKLVEVLRGHGAVETAMTELGHRSAVRRARAAQILGLCRAGHAVPELVSALDDPTLEVRNSAAYGLGLIGDPSAAAPVLAALGAPDRGLPASVAAEAVESMGVGISEALRASLADPSARTRTVAAFLTGAGSFTKGLPELRGLLDSDPDLTVRETAAAAIGQIGRPEDHVVVARHTTIDDPLTLRRACAAALGDLGDPGAVPTLVELLDDMDPRLAEIAAGSLIRLGPAGRDALEAHVDNPAVGAARVVAALQGAGA